MMGDLIEHLNSDHRHALRTETQTFQSWESFMKWKALEEKKAKSWFAKQRADSRTKHHKTSWFYCNRTGEFSSRGEGKRSLKSQGSLKTGCSCPAFITTQTDGVTGEVHAEYCLQHIGHKREIAFNRISSDMRSRIAGKLAQGVSMNSIMDNIRDTQFGQLTRDQLSTRVDLRNIKRQYNINCKEKDSDDASSVLYWVEEMKREAYNPVLCFKRQEEESSDDAVEKNNFLLGLQTEFQKEMFVKYAQKLVCVDATHGTTSYDFQLITVLVIADYDEGIPVGWLISNRETADVLRVFFASIQNKCGDVRMEIFMSDKDQTEEVYAALKTLQNQTEEVSSRRSLQQFLAWLRNVSQPMATYFEKEYSSRPREWAMCFRIGTRANANMFVESLHRTLKEVYLDRKQNRRVDHLLSALRKIARHKAYEWWIKAEKGKATIRQWQSTKRHKQAESMPSELVSRQDAKSWQV